MRYVYVKMVSRVSQQRNALNSNVKQIRIVPRIINVLKVFVETHASNQVHVVLMHNVVLLVAVLNVRVHQTSSVIQKLNVNNLCREYV